MTACTHCHGDSCLNADNHTSSSYIADCCETESACSDLDSSIDDVDDIADCPTYYFDVDEYDMEEIVQGIQCMLSPSKYCS